MRSLASNSTHAETLNAKASLLIPAHDEAGYLDACLSAVLATSHCSDPVEIIVIANACTDRTAEIARAYTRQAQARGWALRVIESVQPGKLNALNLGEDAANAPIRIYLDADVVVSPGLIPDLLTALDRPEPNYASGTPRVPRPQSRFVRAYARFWTGLPFVTSDVPGFGIFAVNQAGRSRWGAFPDIISDDTFVRLQFAPSERIRVDATYAWPMIEGLANLIRVRRRQNTGVTEIERLFPMLLANATRTDLGAMDIARRCLGDPAGCLAYLSVMLGTRLPILSSRHRWVRGR